MPSFVEIPRLSKEISRQAKKVLTDRRTAGRTTGALIAVRLPLLAESLKIIGIDSGSDAAVITLCLTGAQTARCRQFQLSRRLLPASSIAPTLLV